MNRMGLIGVAVAMLIVGGGAAAYMSMRDSFAREDVGDQAALRPVQDQLAGFAGCGIQYRTHQRMSDDRVLLKGCADDATAWIKVPAGWKFPDLAFEATRDGVNRRWRIYVDQQRVALDTVVAALSGLAPAVMTDGNASLAKAQGATRAWQQGQPARDQAAKDQADKNRASYGK